MLCFQKKEHFKLTRNFCAVTFTVTCTCTANCVLCSHTDMFTRMLKLRLLNAVAPAYFFTATAVTFIFHFGFFIPTIFPSQGTSLDGSKVLHTVIFLFLMFNALGNYIMTIKYPAESANETVIPVCSPHCSDKVDAHYLLNGRHFCKLCKKVILKRDHHCFFTGNCIGNKNMRYFIMFCIYTSCTCLYSLVLGVAFLTVEYSISFENPLTFLTLLPFSTGYFFMGEFSINADIAEGTPINNSIFLLLESARVCMIHKLDLGAASQFMHVQLTLSWLDALCKQKVKTARRQGFCKARPH